MQEMKIILGHLGLAQEKVELLVSIFLKKVVEARVQNLAPAPNFRDLSNLAKLLVKAQEREAQFANNDDMQIELSTQKKRRAELEQSPNDVKRKKAHSVKPLPIHSSVENAIYVAISNQHDTKLAKVKALFRNYINCNSYSPSFFNQSLGQLTDALQFLLSEEINTVEACVGQLAQISASNQDLQLRNLIQFITDEIINSDPQESQGYNL
jgi:hypothetical protein